MNCKFLCFLLVFFTIQTYSSQTFTLKSKTLTGQFTQEQSDQFGCNGKNIPTQLYWENPLEGTKSFATTLYDEDAHSSIGLYLISRLIYRK